LDRQQEVLKKQNDDLLKQKPTMAAAVFEQKQKELEKQFVDLQQTYIKLERELAQDRTKLVQDLLKQAQPHIEQIARTDGLTVVLDRQAVVWNDPVVDVTSRLAAQMK